MIYLGGKKEETGQSMIELLVILPVLLLFLATICPLLAAGTVMPWLDEKLWLRQFIQLEKILQSELEDAHGKSWIPLYFERSDLVETTNTEKLGFSFPLYENIYPGLVNIQEVMAHHPEGAGTILGRTDRTGKKIQRSLAMLMPTATPEPEIPRRVKKMSVLGIFPWKLDVMKNLDLNLFHLNLDALPGEEQ